MLNDGTKQRIIMIDTTLLSGIYGAEKPNDPKPEDRFGDHNLYRKFI